MQLLARGAVPTEAVRASRQGGAFGCTEHADAKGTRKGTACCSNGYAAGGGERGVSPSRLRAACALGSERLIERLRGSHQGKPSLSSPQLTHARWAAGDGMKMIGTRPSSSMAIANRAIFFTPSSRELRCPFGSPDASAAWI